MNNRHIDGMRDKLGCKDINWTCNNYSSPHPRGLISQIYHLPFTFHHSATTNWGSAFVMESGSNLN